MWLLEKFLEYVPRIFLLDSAALILEEFIGVFHCNVWTGVSTPCNRRLEDFQQMQMLKSFLEYTLP